MDRPAFYASLRSASEVFGNSLSQRQVDGLEPLLDACQGLPLPHTAHVLAECYHETGGGMYPVKETVFHYHEDKNPSDSTVIRRLNRAYDRGQLPWVSSPYWRSGFFGRGQIQLTHKSNYEKLSPYVGVDLAENPSKALDPSISAQIAAQGCEHGLFTGKKLSDYDDGMGYDHYHARAIVNGDTSESGRKVQTYAHAFEDALEAAGYDEANPSTPEQPSELETVRAERDRLREILAQIRGMAEDAL